MLPEKTEMLREKRKKCYQIKTDRDVKKRKNVTRKNR